MNSTKVAENSIQAAQDSIIEDFELLEDWTEKYKYIIELGQVSPGLPEALKTPDIKIKGCQSNVWLHTELKDGKIVFSGDSDAMITKGLINLLINVLSDREPREILEGDLYFIDRIGMKQHLSPTRANGLASMIKQMKIYALAYKTKLENAN